MRAASDVTTVFRSASRLIGAEVASTSGRHDAYLDRLVSASSWLAKPATPALQGSSCPVRVCLLQSSSKHCKHSYTGSVLPAQRHICKQAVDNTQYKTQMQQTLLRTASFATRQQHSFKPQPLVRSLWQRSYYSSGYGYRRSIWDGDNVLYGLIATNLAGFLLWQSYPGLMYRHATVSVSSVREGRIYTLLTSAFSHNAFSHILANMFTFYFFGRNISHVLGGKKVGPHKSCLLVFLSKLNPWNHHCLCSAAFVAISGWRGCWQLGSRYTVLHPSTEHGYHVATQLLLVSNPNCRNAYFSSSLKCCCSATSLVMICIFSSCRERPRTMAHQMQLVHLPTSVTANNQTGMRWSL